MIKVCSAAFLQSKEKIEAPEVIFYQYFYSPKNYSIQKSIFSALFMNEAIIFWI